MSTPVISLNNSPAMWPELPLPPEAILILPGLALARVTNSDSVLAGTDGCTTMTLGRRTMLATGAMSRMKLKLSLAYKLALTAFGRPTSSNVYPSGDAFTTASVPMLVPVLNDEWLSETFRQPLTRQARHDVEGSAGRNPDDDADRPGRIGLRPRDAGCGR